MMMNMINGYQVMVHDGYVDGWSFKERILAVARGETRSFRPLKAVKGMEDGEVGVNHYGRFLVCSSRTLADLKQRIA